MNKSPNYCALLILNTCPSDSQSPEWLLFLTIFIIMSVITLDEISWRRSSICCCADGMAAPWIEGFCSPLLDATAAPSGHYCQSPADKEGDLITVLQSKTVLEFPQDCNLKGSLGTSQST